MVKGKGTLILLCFAVAITACNGSPVEEKEANRERSTVKKRNAAPSVNSKWTENERREFLQDCTASAVKSYEIRKQPADSAAIVNICTCLGKSLEQKYSYADANKLSGVEVKAEISNAAKNCN